MEFEARFAKNQRVEGFGVEGVRIHVPCPFCAGADWIVHGLVDVESKYGAGAMCRYCGRGARVLFSKSSNATTLTFVQTYGDDPSPWARMPREGEIIT